MLSAWLLAGCDKESPEGQIAEIPAQNSTDVSAATPTPSPAPELSPSSSPTPASPSTLTMLSITEGSVFIMKAGTDNWVEAQEGMSLEIGDSVKSGDDSGAEITFFDGSTIELLAGTQVSVAELDIATGTGATTIRLKQEIGDTISRVTKLTDPASRYEVETPAGVAAVRGSSMLVEVITSGITWVTNLEGEIWVVAEGVELQIPEGRKCIIKPGRAPQLLASGNSGGGGSSLKPDIALTKIAEPAQAYDGDTITYTYQVSNPGDYPLSDVAVADDIIDTVTYQEGDTNQDNKLGTDETWIYTATYVVAAEDISPLVNTASAAGTDTRARTVIAWATASVDILRPDIVLTKTAEPVQAYDGDTVTYTYQVSNPGNVPLSDISVTDDMIDTVTYQEGDTNQDNQLGTDETWIYTATYVVAAEDISPLVNTATVTGNDPLSRTVTGEASASVDILRPFVLTFPDDGTAYVGYEDQSGGDFDYNDFGMSMAIEEVYIGDYLSSVSLEFTSVVHLAGSSHDIHIQRTLADGTSYNYTITRTIPAQGSETPEVTDASGQGDFDIVLFDSDYYTEGATVTIAIEITDGLEPYEPAPETSRWDLDPVLASYDPYMAISTTGAEHHIEQWQPAVLPLPTVGYDVPYILIVPVNDWSEPPEGTTITHVYPYFDDYYDTGAPENWYE